MSSLTLTFQRLWSVARPTVPAWRYNYTSILLQGYCSTILFFSTHKKSLSPLRILMQKHFLRKEKYYIFFSSVTTVWLHVLFLLIVRVLHCSLVVRWYRSAALMTCLISVVMLLCFRLRRLWQPMTSWSRSWLRSCRTSVKGRVTRRWRRRTKVKQHFLSRQNKDTRIHRGHHEELDRHRV